MLTALAVSTATARADVSILLEQPINLLGGVTSAGHAVLWLHEVCSDDQVHARACAAGESGVVLGRYTHAAGYDWLLMPVMPYLYATNHVSEVPASANAAGVKAMRARYRAGHEAESVEGLSDALWGRLLGTSYRRTVLVMHLRTTPAEEARLLLWLQGRKNRSHFNLFWNNCADLTRQALDVLYPGAVRRSFLFDGGIMTPEQIGSEMSRYARKHPEVDATVSVLPQVPGSIKRSGRMYGTAESFVKTKPYLLPLTVLNPLEFGLVIATGLGDRRFDVQEHVKTAPRMLPQAVATEARLEEPAATGSTGKSR